MNWKQKIFLFIISSILAPVALAEPAPAGGTMSSMIMIGVIFVMMYFLMIRPQSKRAKEHKDLISNINKGDEVVIQGGLLGRVARDSGNFFIIQLSDGVEVPVQKQAVSQLLPKGTIKSI